MLPLFADEDSWILICSCNRTSSRTHGNTWASPVATRSALHRDLTSKLTVKQKEVKSDYIRVYRLSFGDFHGDALCWVKEGALKAGPGGYHTNPKESKPRLPLKVSFQDIISSSSDSSEEEDLGIEVHISDFSLVSFLGGEVEITGTFADKLLSGTEIVIEHAP